MHCRVLILCLMLSAFVACSGQKEFEGTIGTGSANGTNHALGAKLSEIASRESERVTWKTQTSAGSVENMRRLEQGEIDLAIVQNDTAGSKSVRTVAVLYQELLHVFVRKASPIHDLRGLVDKTIAVGPKGSGTAQVALEILEHFGLSQSFTRRVHLSLDEATIALKRGEVDAVFALAAAPFPTGAELLSSESARLLPLGDAHIAGSALDGIRAANPYLTRSVIPAATYGQYPKAPVGTMSVQAILVARDDVATVAVKDVTRALFASKVELAEAHGVAAFLDERFDVAQVRFPLHDGAAAFYNRDEPSFFVQYAEAMSFGFTILVALGSGFLALREWMRRRKKNRIDAYYAEVAKIAAAAEEGSVDVAMARTQLLAVRRRAFQELMKERLEADESFTIFQDFVRAETEALTSRAD